MKTNQEILDEFGKNLIIKVDEYYKYIRKNINEGCKNVTTQKYNKIFDSINSDTKVLLEEYIFENIDSLIFDFLCVFEESPQFKIIYEENGQQVDLTKISEMLKAEPIIENGWIKRFSKFRNNSEE